MQSRVNVEKEFFSRFPPSRCNISRIYHYVRICSLSAMDPPLDPPLRVISQAPSVSVSLEEAQLVIQKFIQESKSSAWSESETKLQDGNRGTNSIVLGQLQRLDDALMKETAIGD